MHAVWADGCAQMEDENKGFILSLCALGEKNLSALSAPNNILCAAFSAAHALEIYYFVNPLSTHSAAFEWQFSFLRVDGKKRRSHFWKYGGIFLLHIFIHNAFLHSLDEMRAKRAGKSRKPCTCQHFFHFKWRLGKNSKPLSVKNSCWWVSLSQCFAFLIADLRNFRKL